MSTKSAGCSGEMPVLERRREARCGVDQPCGVASILGDPESRSICQILDISRSGIRILLRRTFPEDAQIHVQWGGRFFIGTPRYTMMKGGSCVIGLKLLTSNLGKSPWHGIYMAKRLAAFCRAKLAGVFQDSGRCFASRDSQHT